MTTMTKVLGAYTPTESEAADHARLLARYQTRDTIGANPVEKMASSFSIEVVNSHAPIDLFGQAVPSLKMNKLSFFDRNGDHMLSFLMSEQAICNLLFDSNRSDRVPATAIEADGFSLPTWRHDPEVYKLKNRVMNMREDHTPVKMAKYFEEIENSKGAIKKSTLSEIERIIHNRASDLSSNRTIDFYMERHMENLTAAKCDVLTEFANAATMHSSNQMYMLNTDYLPFDVDELRQHHPMIEALNGFETEAEIAIMQKAIQQAVKATFENARLTQQAENYNPTEGGDYHCEAKNHRSAIWDLNPRLARDEEDELEENLGILNRLANSYFNKHVLKKWHRPEMQQLCIESSIRESHGAYLNTEYNYGDQRIIEIRIDRGYIEDFYGKPQLQDTDNVMTVCIVREDFLSALRGSIGNQLFPCTTRTYAGVYLDAHKLADGIGQKALNDLIDIEDTADIEAMIERHQALIELINPLLAQDKISKKADKAALIDILKKMDDLMDAFRVIKDQHLDNGLDNLTLKVVNDISGSIQRSLEVLNLENSDVERLKKLIHIQ